MLEEREESKTPPLQRSPQTPEAPPWNPVESRGIPGAGVSVQVLSGHRQGLGRDGAVWTMDSLLLGNGSGYMERHGKTYCEGFGSRAWGAQGSKLCERRPRTGAVWFSPAQRPRIRSTDAQGQEKLLKPSRGPSREITQHFFFLCVAAPVAGGSSQARNCFPAPQQ